MSITRQSAMVLGQYLTMTRTRWRKLLEAARDPYRPERHYMRGPGLRKSIGFQIATLADSYSIPLQGEFAASLVERNEILIR